MRVTGGAGSADSDTATITVATPPASGTAPAITSQPDDQRLTSGESATMTVDASGTSPLSYQWYAGTRGTTSEPAAGATSMRWETPPVTSTASFWVRVSNPFGSTDSNTATVTVIEAAPPPPPEPPPPVDTSDAFEGEVIALVNQHRAAGAACGGNPYPAVDPLSLDTNLLLSHEPRRDHLQPADLERRLFGWIPCG